MIYHSLKQTSLIVFALILFASIGQAQMRTSPYQSLDYSEVVQEGSLETGGQEPAPEMFIPNAFTPNGDGINDFFQPTYIGQTQIYSLVIFDRDGRQVFETNSMRQLWDGTTRGKSLNTGVYIFGITYLDTDGKKQLRSGSITLLR